MKRITQYHTSGHAGYKNKDMKKAYNIEDCEVERCSTCAGMGFNYVGYPHTAVVCIACDGNKVIYYPKEEANELNNAEN